ncbi:MAG: hypothetical protein AABW65_01505 [Nanoarchaeota archaeon]
MSYCHIFHRIIYLYEYAPEDIEVKAKQSFYSRLLLDLKDRHTNNILLIPIATNMNVSSLDLIIKNYGIKESPVIFIDEEHLIDYIITLDDLENIVIKSSKE